MKSNKDSDREETELEANDQLTLLICLHVISILSSSSFFDIHPSRFFIPHFHLSFIEMINIWTPRSYLWTRLHSLETSWRASSKTIGLAHIRQRERFSSPQHQKRMGHDSHCHHTKLQIPKITQLEFWQSTSAWRRAAINTFRCLIGCTAGDFSAMWSLQSFYPEIGIPSIMAISMASGLASSITLETVLLRYGKDRLETLAALKTALGMSLVSMLSMEAVSNVVDYHLTGGVVTFADPAFWGAALLSMGAGYLAPLPYNYLRLRKFGKACH